MQPAVQNDQFKHRADMKRALNLLNDLDTDFKATAKVAELVENGDYNKDQVIILPIGAKKSAYAKDINGYSFFHSKSMLKDVLVVQTNREGLYDMLPEGLFHGTPTKNSSLSDSEMIADVKLKREEEKNARTFFMPFEVELNHMRVTLELYENRLDKKTSYNDLSAIFGAAWEEFDYLDNDQRITWMHLLPVIKQKRNDVPFLRKLLPVLFGMPIQVVLNPSAINKTLIPEDLQFKLGGGDLGTDSIIGDSICSESEEIHLLIGPAEDDKLLKFLPGMQYKKLMDTVTSYLIPIESSLKFELISKEENKIGLLGADSLNSYLGFTFYLSNSNY
jgi:type VI secretion system protein ImpH